MTVPIISDGQVYDPDLWEFCLFDPALYVAALRYQGQLSPRYGPVQLPYWPGGVVTEPGIYFTVGGVPIPALPNPITPG